MSLAVIIEVLIALLKFPAELSAFVKLISKTPDEKRAEIVGALQKQLDDFESGGRPL